MTFTGFPSQCGKQSIFGLYFCN